jgi:hypothetical protein
VKIRVSEDCNSLLTLCAANIKYFKLRPDEIESFKRKRAHNRAELQLKLEREHVTQYFGAFGKEATAGGFAGQKPNAYRCHS